MTVRPVDWISRMEPKASAPVEEYEQEFRKLVAATDLHYLDAPLVESPTGGEDESSRSTYHEVCEFLWNVAPGGGAALPHPKILVTTVCNAIVERGLVTIYFREYVASDPTEKSSSLLHNICMTPGCTPAAIRLMKRANPTKYDLRVSDHYRPLEGTPDSARRPFSVRTMVFDSPILRHDLGELFPQSLHVKYQPNAKGPRDSGTSRHFALGATVLRHGTVDDFEALFENFPSFWLDPAGCTAELKEAARARVAEDSSWIMKIYQTMEWTPYNVPLWEATVHRYLLFNTNIDNLFPVLFGADASPEYCAEIVELIKVVENPWEFGEGHKGRHLTLATIASAFRLNTFVTRKEEKTTDALESFLTFAADWFRAGLGSAFDLHLGVGVYVGTDAELTEHAIKLLKAKKLPLPAPFKPEGDEFPQFRKYIWPLLDYLRSIDPEDDELNCRIIGGATLLEYNARKIYPVNLFDNAMKYLNGPYTVYLGDKAEEFKKNDIHKLSLEVSSGMFGYCICHYDDFKSIYDNYLGPYYHRKE